MGVLVVGFAFAAAAVLVTFVALAVVFKLLLRLILLPLLLLKFILLGAVMLVVGLLLAVPLLPFAIVGGLVWLIVRANRPAVA